MNQARQREARHGAATITIRPDAGSQCRSPVVARQAVFTRLVEPGGSALYLRVRGVGLRRMAEATSRPLSVRPGEPLVLNPNTASDDLNLGQYLVALRRRWWVVIGITGIALAATVIATLLLRAFAPSYQAETSVLLTGAKYQLTFDPKFTTIDPLSGAAPPQSRADEYQAIALSTAVREDAA